MKRLAISTFMTGLTLTAMAQDACHGIPHNGACCPYGAFKDSECCPYGNIVDEYCCMSYEGSQGQSWGNIISGNGQSCPNYAVAITMDSSRYTSLVSSAASKLGISNVPITANSLTATASPYGTPVDSVSYTATPKAATSTGGSASASPLPSSTSTGSGAQITLRTLYLGVVFGVGAYVL